MLGSVVKLAQRIALVHAWRCGTCGRNGCGYLARCNAAVALVAPDCFCWHVLHYDFPALLLTLVRGPHVLDLCLDGVNFRFDRIEVVRP